MLVSEAFKYLMASAIALGADAGLSVGLIRLAGVPYQFAAATGFLAGLFIVYGLSTLWVFQVRSVDSRIKEFLIFAGVGIAGLALNAGILYIGVSLMHHSYEIAKLMSVSCVFTFNFLLRKSMLFTKGKIR